MEYRPRFTPWRSKLQERKQLFVITNVTMPDGIVVWERTMLPESLLASNRPTVTVVLAVPTGPLGGAYGGTGVEVGVVGVGGFAAGVLRDARRYT